MPLKESSYCFLFIVLPSGLCERNNVSKRLYREKKVIFAENKLRSANRKQVFFALTCIIFVENKLRSANRKQIFFASSFIISHIDNKMIWQ
ncbi:hypothetical protein ADJ77_08855 [Prevotella fusca JCM 17724]|uniref:Uncharacterized protein n=1 Tax=Prevotella fusca JCM 17724 TaxID=1236517 RepID=A0A0K1NMN6_9BACT|nr:hypothetical protein ADJ77_08855 [Prevotella fusca JCM 17724]